MPIFQRESRIILSSQDPWQFPCKDYHSMKFNRLRFSCHRTLGKCFVRLESHKETYSLLNNTEFWNSVPAVELFQECLCWIIPGLCLFLWSALLGDALLSNWTSSGYRARYCPDQPPGYSGMLGRKLALSKLFHPA